MNDAANLQLFLQISTSGQHNWWSGGLHPEIRKRLQWSLMLMRRPKHGCSVVIWVPGTIRCRVEKILQRTIMRPGGLCV